MRNNAKTAAKATKVMFRTEKVASGQSPKEVKEAYNLLSALAPAAKINTKTLSLAHNNWNVSQTFTYMKSMRKTLRQIVRSQTVNRTTASISKLAGGRVIRIELPTDNKNWRQDAAKYLKREVKNNREIAKTTEVTRRIRTRSSVFDATKDTGLQVYTRPGQMLAFAEIRKSSMVRIAKRPMTNEEHTGIELEFIIPHTVQEANVMKDLTPFGKYIEYKGDGSVGRYQYTDEYGEQATKSTKRNPNDYGKEIAICAPVSEYKAVLTGVCNVLAKHGAYVEKCCGLHVHVDARRNATQRNATTVYNNLRLAQALLLSMQPKSRRDNHYCKKSTSTDFYSAIHQSRYHAINASAFNEHSTIEVRCHSGTIDATKISRWVDILRSLADAPLVNKPIVTDKALAEACPNIPASLVLHAKERRKQFRAPRGSKTKAA